MLDFDVVPQHEKIDGNVLELYRPGYVRLAAGAGSCYVHDEFSVEVLYFGIEDHERAYVDARRFYACGIARPLEGPFHAGRVQGNVCVGDCSEDLLAAVPHPEIKLEVVPEMKKGKRELVVFKLLVCEIFRRSGDAYCRRFERTPYVYIARDAALYRESGPEEARYVRKVQLFELELTVHCARGPEGKPADGGIVLVVKVKGADRYAAVFQQRAYRAFVFEECVLNGQLDFRDFDQLFFGVEPGSLEFRLVFPVRGFGYVNPAVDFTAPALGIEVGGLHSAALYLYALELALRLQLKVRGVEVGFGGEIDLLDSQLLAP